VGIPPSSFLADFFNALALDPFIHPVDINALLPSLIQGCSMLAIGLENTLALPMTSFSSVFFVMKNLTLLALFFCLIHF
jgi:hypothetical protein